MNGILLPVDCAKSATSLRPHLNKTSSFDFHGYASAIRSLPTCLFNVSIARLKYRLECLDQLEDLEPESQILEQCHRVMMDAPEAYGCITDGELKHQSTLKLLLDDLSDEYGRWQHRDHHGGGSVVWGCPARIILTGKKVSPGNATLQGVLTYVQHLLQPTVSSSICG